jgi:hypothetical protein
MIARIVVQLRPGPGGVDTPSVDRRAEHFVTVDNSWITGIWR